jgi:predicted Zn finger-like uncharacterized protein
VSLATRCTACGTVFRVVQDQLRVSGGWVRCGRCSQVFNAVESLVDLELDRPAEGAPPSAHGDRVMQDLARVAGLPAPTGAEDPDDVAAGDPRLPADRPAGLIESDGAPRFLPASGVEPAQPDSPRAPPATSMGAADWVAVPPGDGRGEPAADDAGAGQAAARRTAPAGDDEESPVERTVPLGPPGYRDDDSDAAEAADDDAWDGGAADAAGVGDADAADGAESPMPGQAPAAADAADGPDRAAEVAEVDPAATAVAVDVDGPPGREDPADWARLATGAEASGAGRRRRGPREAAAAPPPPSFLRDAERAARWRQPWVRVSLSLVVLVLAALLAGQVTWVQHDLVAARWPALRPVVQTLCEHAGCTIEPPRRIESLAVESSGLVRAGEPGSYRLNVLLRNREDLALMPPSLDLSLTDAEGRLIARRVVTPAELGAADRVVPPAGELTLQALLRSQNPGVVGYTIEIFYP